MYVIPNFAALFSDKGSPSSSVFGRAASSYALACLFMISALARSGDTRLSSSAAR